MLSVILDILSTPAMIIGIVAMIGLILQKESLVDTKQTTINKSSISFRAHHNAGSLAKVLTIIGEHNINLTKIQSLPVVGEEWQYYMYVDLEFNDYDDYKKMLSEIEPLTKELKILGEYKQGEKVDL